MKLKETQGASNFELDGKVFIYDNENPINEGKTKKVLKVLNDDLSESDEYYIIEEKNIASAGDGKRMETVEGNDGKGKGDYSATINANYFEYLNDLGIETGFIKKIDSNHTLVKKLDMIPVECVYRFVETGSYTKRQNHILGKNANPDGTVLKEPIIELFYKDDVEDKEGNIISDPMIALDNNQIPKVDEDGLLILLYPKTGEKIDYKKDGDLEKMRSQMSYICENHHKLTEETKKVGLGVKSFGDKVGLSTLDGKVEFGEDKEGNIVLGDSIDADSNRIRKVFTIIGEDGKTYLTKDFSKEELKQSGKDSSYFEKLKVIPKNIKVKKLGLVIGLDKDGFRQGETSDEYLIKVKNLAIESTKALEIHNEEVARLLNKHIENIEAILDPDNIKAMSEFINGELLDILGRKIA